MQVMSHENSDSDTRGPAERATSLTLGTSLDTHMHEYSGRRAQFDFEFANNWQLRGRAVDRKYGKERIQASSDALREIRPIALRCARAAGLRPSGLGSLNDKFDLGDLVSPQSQSQTPRTSPFSQSQSIIWQSRMAKH
jgi:hypothetical protein